MVENDWKVLEWLKMALNGCQMTYWLEWLEMDGNCWKILDLLDLDGNGGEWLAMGGMA